MTTEARRYLINSGRIDDMSFTVEQDAAKYMKVHAGRKACKNPAGCAGEMYFSHFITIRPGRADQQLVEVYVCNKCGYASMEGEAL